MISFVGLLCKVQTITSFMIQSSPTNRPTINVQTKSNTMRAFGRIDETYSSRQRKNTRQTTRTTPTGKTSTTFLVAASKDRIILTQPAPDHKGPGNDDANADVADVDTINDKNGNPIEVGSVIRVAKQMKAYQVPAKARGSYDMVTKEFIPIDSTTATVSRKDQNLVLPIGIRGVVVKVYRQSDESDLSANFPIKVQFTPGTNIDNDDGYDPPVAFSMHFDPMEIETCS